MKAIIMAGGMGTRLKCVSGDRPKPLVPLLGKAVMEHLVVHLRDCGFTDICAAVKYRAGDIMACFGDGSSFGVNMQYRIEDKALGTAGAVKNCEDFYGDEDFLVISGDAACDMDLKLLMEEHRKNGAAVTIALYRDPEPLRYGLAVTDDEGMIRSFVEKPEWPRVVTDFVNTGIYALSPRAMRYVPEGREYDFGKELFPLLLEKGEKMVGLPMEGYWCDIGTPLSYYQCCVDAIEGRLKIDVPDEFRPSPEYCEENSSEQGYTEECECASRAELMGTLSGLMMEMGADYSDGIRLHGKNYKMHIYPSAVRSAVRISVQANNAEFARELALSAKAVAEALGM